MTGVLFIDEAIFEMVNAAYKHAGGSGETDAEILGRPSRVRGTPSFVVGIDPGASTGVGILRWSDDKVMWWGTRDFFSVQDLLVANFREPQDVKVIVEVPPDFAYARNDHLEGKVRDNYIFKAGGNRREAQLLAGAIRKLGFDVVEVSPVREEKWTSEKMRLFARSSKRSNQHERDAVRLALHYKTKR